MLALKFRDLKEFNLPSLKKHLPSQLCGTPGFQNLTHLPASWDRAVDCVQGRKFQCLSNEEDNIGWIKWDKNLGWKVSGSSLKCMKVKAERRA